MLDWEQLVTEHGPRVWRTAYRILANHADAMDCYQETFLDVHRSPPKSPVADWPAYFGALPLVERSIDGESSDVDGLCRGASGRAIFCERRK
jgi:hypothetical protein